jgi:D-serine deaminase-like pyridoxal phosphate-dependent protein
VDVHDLPTPSLIVDRAAFEHNVATMSEALPGNRLRPHVKAFKSTALARELAAAGHRTFCCATVKEMEGMAAAGLGDDLLLANEVIGRAAERLGRLARSGPARVTAAVDSEATIEAAAAAGVTEVLIDVCVGLPRCGCPPEEAGRLADVARDRALAIRGVMGYEGHLMREQPAEDKAAKVEEAMALLLSAADAVGGDVISAGGTGTYDCNTWATEIQAGSYTLMDTEYVPHAPAFRNALFLLTTVVSVYAPAGWAVLDGGLKCLGMDHGNPTVVGGQCFYVHDEHITYFPDRRPLVGDRVRVIPAHVDPTVAMHERMYVVDGDEVLDTWDVNLRNW